LFGFVFFGDPILLRGAKYLNRRFPHWQKILELRKLVTVAFHDCYLRNFG
jgi:hypothetical protein